MGQNRPDKLWPKPRLTRFVWVSQPGLQMPPVQGLVLDWRRHSYRWSALVAAVRLDDQGAPDGDTRMGAGRAAATSEERPEPRGVPG